MATATKKTAQHLTSQRAHTATLWACILGAAALAACSFDSSQLDKGECQVNEECGFNEQCVNFVCVPVDVPDIVQDIQQQSPASCGLATCESGEACCNFACVDTRTDAENCGGCGITCADNETCTQGQCLCGGSNIQCDDAAGDFCCGQGAEASCVSVRNSVLNCGGCGLSCKLADQETGATSEQCSGGACVCRSADGSLAQCGASQSCCLDAGCVDLQTDTAHCGACGVSCGIGEQCVGGQCVCGATASEGEPACDGLAGQQCCGSPAACVPTNDPTCFCGETRCFGEQRCCPGDGGLQCVNSDRDVLNCGGCGDVCQAGEVCEAGACTVSCPAGWVKCRSSGRDVCVDPLVSNQFCGAKGTCEGTNPASSDYAGAACAPGTVCDGAGACQLQCQAGLVACDVDGERRCVDPQVDERACGARGACSSATPSDPSFQGATCDADERCVGGLCQCPGQLVLCDGACVDPLTDASACGARGACSSATPSDPNFEGAVCGAGRRCEGGVCACAPGLVLCDGACVDPQASDAYCGVDAACGGGDVCDEAGERCEGGACVCAPGLVLCGGRCVDPRTDRDSCGAKGTCQSTDPASLNFRGLDCADGTVCDGNGACALSCAAGLVLCNGACVDPLTNGASCGARGTCDNALAASPNYRGATCNASIGQACVNGQCTCVGGEALCGGVCVDPQKDNAYCGVSATCTGGDICTLGEACINGQCECGVGLIRCDGRCVDPLTHPAYCGAFADCSNARVCVPGSQCVSGACRCNGTGSVCSTNEGSSCTGTTCNP